VFVAVIPNGKFPNASVALPPIFTPVGWTVNEKLLPGKTVVGEGVAQIASSDGLVVGYGNEFDTLAGDPALATVNDSAPGAAMKSCGSGRIIVVEVFIILKVTGI
jgi:hypothetical protein